MTYEELILILNSNHFYPEINRTLKLNSEKITGLEISCSPILKDSRMGAVKTALPDGFKCIWNPNSEAILIKKTV